MTHKSFQQADIKASDKMTKSETEILPHRYAVRELPKRVLPAVFLPARRYTVESGIWYDPVSVRLSVCHKPLFHRNDRTIAVPAKETRHLENFRRPPSQVLSIQFDQQR